MSETERMEEKRGYLSSKRMTKSMYEELDECSLMSAWQVLRKHCLPQLLGIDYCPVPYVDRSQYFDMNNVFVVTRKTRLFGKSARHLRYAAKLRDVLKLRRTTELGEELFLDTIDQEADQLHVINNKQWDLNFVMDLQMTQDDVKKQLHLAIEEIIAIGSNLNWNDATYAYVERKRDSLLENAKEIIIINQVVAAFGLTIRYNCGVSEDEEEGEDGIQEWIGSDGPIPIAFQACKFKVKKDGRLVGRKSVSTETLFHEATKWILPDGHPLQCVVLNAYFTGQEN